MFVVDASITLAWCFDDETTSEPRRSCDALHPGGCGGAGTLAPRGRQRPSVQLRSRGRADDRRLDGRPRSSDELADRGPCRSDISTTLALCIRPALEHRLTVYDAAYLDLADGLGLAVATLDQRLVAAIAVPSGFALIE